MPQVQYDPNVIRDFASRLYARAELLVFLRATSFGLVGAVIGSAIAYDEWRRAELWLVWSVLGGLLGFAPLSAAGWYFGSRSAMSLKLRAQLALCQVRIEENTRPT